MEKGAIPADAGSPIVPGSFVVTNRTVLVIAVPMTLAYLTTPLLGMVDTAVVGQLGDAALLGGLAAGALVFDVVFTTFNFLRSGTTGLVAQAFGRNDALEEQAVFWRAVLIAVVAGIVLAALSPLIAAGGRWFMDAGPRVSEAMGVYIGIRLLAAPFSLINYAILGYVLGRGEGGLGLVLQLVLTASTSRSASCLAWSLAGASPASPGQPSPANSWPCCLASPSSSDGSGQARPCRANACST